jgi:hypothetical protein
MSQTPGQPDKQTLRTSRDVQRDILLKSIEDGKPIEELRARVVALEKIETNLRSQGHQDNLTQDLEFRDLYQVITDGQPIIVIATLAATTRLNVGNLRTRQHPSASRSRTSISSASTGRGEANSSSRTGDQGKIYIDKYMKAC